MNQFQLPEKIVIAEITQLLKQINRQINSVNHSTDFDLSGVKLIDSAGIAFLVYLKSKYKNAQFLNSTAQINNLCQLYKIQL